jgi:hypothetical protein
MQEIQNPGENVYKSNNAFVTSTGQLVLQVVADSNGAFSSGVSDYLRQGQPGTESARNIGPYIYRSILLPVGCISFRDNNATCDIHALPQLLYIITDHCMPCWLTKPTKNLSSGGRSAIPACTASKTSGN